MNDVTRILNSIKLGGALEQVDIEGRGYSGHC